MVSGRVEGGGWRGGWCRGVEGGGVDGVEGRRGRRVDGQRRGEGGGVNGWRGRGAEGRIGAGVGRVYLNWGSLDRGGASGLIVFFFRTVHLLQAQSYCSSVHNNKIWQRWRGGVLTLGTATQGHASVFFNLFFYIAAHAGLISAL